MFEEVIRKLQDLQRNAAELDGEHSVPFAELFPDEFMLRQTEFSGVQAMFDASGFKVVSSEDFAAIPDGQWDIFVKERTRFSSWDEMKSAAVQEWAARRMDSE
jgi:hypothetical protein